MRLPTVQVWLGRLANWIGFPGLVQDIEYRSKAFGTSVRVKRGNLYTVVTVNGVDVYFCRFSGQIDGVGFSRDADYKPELIQESIGPVERLAERLTKARNRMM